MNRLALCLILMFSFCVLGLIILGITIWEAFQ